MGRIANLTLRQMGGGNWFCVNIAQGRLELEDCDITNLKYACVGIHGGADPRLRRNRIHDSKEGTGAIVFENAQGTLEDNEIYGNALTGVEIRSNPTLRRNRIHSGKQGGVFVNIGGQETLEDNDIFGNDEAGIEVTTAGNPVARNNRVNKNALYGIWVYSNGRGTFENNDVCENAAGAWSIAEDSEANVKRVNNKE